MGGKSILKHAAGAACTLAATMPHGFAQQAPSPPRLEEITVTAQRVARNLQKTPVAVTSFSAATLKQQGITNILDLNGMAPNVSVGIRGGSGPAAGDITIRGIGANADPPASPSVGVYIDDVYFPGTYGNLLGLFDVARVEIDRGPQGTLFGRNTIAGALQYETVRPTLNQYNGFVEDTVGNLNRNDVSAGVNIPIGAIAALRLSGGDDNRNGYIHDILNDDDRGADRTEEGRGQLRIQPNADLTIDLKGEYVSDHGNGTPTVLTGINYNAILALPFAPNGLNPFISPNDHTIVGLDGPDFSKTQFRIAQGIINYRVSDWLTVKSITAASANESAVDTDTDRTPLPIIEVHRGEVNDRLFTQELQLVGEALGDRLHFTLGGYFYDDHASTTDDTAVIFSQVSDAFGSYDNGTQSYAGYGQATYNITKQISVVGGIRYTAENVRATDSLLTGAAARSFSDVSPLIGLNYQVTPDLLLYVKDSRGFRAGGFSPNAGEDTYYGPETATTYEAGARYQFLDRRIRINPTIFYTDWRGIQFNSISVVTGAPYPIIKNAGNARIDGAEVEVQGAVTDNLLVTASGSLLSTKYTHVDASQLDDISYGSGLERAPQASYTVGARYTLPLGDERSVTLSGDYSWQAHQRSAADMQNNVPIPSYGLLNARLEFQPFKRFTLAVFATNLLNKTYLIGGTNYGNGGLIPSVTDDIGLPREYGLTGRVTF